jgi:AAA family ATPase
VELGPATRFCAGSKIILARLFLYFPNYSINHENSQTRTYFIMSTNKDTQKTLEVKIRPFQNSAIERADQKGLSRVHLSKEALFDLKLEAGQPCLLWKVGEDEGQKIEAIAWPTSEKSLGKKAAQMTRSFQEICGFKLSDELKISAGGSLQMMESVIVKDTTALDTLPELKAKEKPAWDWLLREFLCKWTPVFNDRLL